MASNALTTPFVIGSLGCFVLFKLYQFASSRGYPPRPPGPSGYPLIGNLRDMPLTYAWLTFTEWGRKYGPINYIKVAGQPVLIVNSQDVAVDLLEKTIYSDRPRCVMATELAGLGEVSVLQGYGPVLRKHRKLLVQALHPRIVRRDFVPLQERIARKLMKAILQDPGRFFDQVQFHVGEVIQTFTYGACKDGDVDLIELGNENMTIFGKTVAGYSVDFLPWLKYIPDWLPGAQFKRDAKIWRGVTEAARRVPFDMVKRQRAAGEVTQPSYTKSLLDENEVNGGGREEEEIIAATAGTLFGGGSDTISGTFLTFLLAMKLYPEVQAKAQAELDSVVGDRLPTVADKESLPYLNAVLQETIRWHPVGPNGVPRRLMQDDVYGGYGIPAGTLIIVNVWGILHDERRFPDPFIFNPDRWLPDGAAKESVMLPIDPFAVNFGYGRRICPGIAVAQSGLWSMMALMLSSFDIRPKGDLFSPTPSPEQVVKEAFTGENISFPKPFECEIKPRTDGRAERIKTAVAEDEKVDGVD